MKSYELVVMSIQGSLDIEVICTNDDILNWITEEIKKIGKCKIHDRRASRIFSNCGYNQWEMGWSIIQQLCEQDWEPFGSVGYEKGYGVTFISLRRRRELTAS